MSFFKPEKKGKESLLKVKDKDVRKHLKFAEEHDKLLAKVFSEDKESAKLSNNFLNSFPGKREKANPLQLLSNIKHGGEVLLDNTVGRTIRGYKKVSKGVNLVANSIYKAGKTVDYYLTELPRRKIEEKESYLVDKAEAAGFLSQIIDNVKNIVKGRASKYAKESEDKESIQKLMSLKELKPEEILNSGISLDEIVNGAFDYLTYKGSLWLADEDKPDFNLMNENIKKNLMDMVGSSTVLADKKDAKGGIAERSKAQIYNKIDKRQIKSALAAKVLLGIHDTKQKDETDSFLKLVKDLMSLYKSMNPSKNWNGAEQLRRILGLDKTRGDMHAIRSLGYKAYEIASKYARAHKLVNNFDINSLAEEEKKKAKAISDAAKEAVINIGLSAATAFLAVGVGKLAKNAKFLKKAASKVVKKFGTKSIVSKTITGAFYKNSQTVTNGMKKAAIKQVVGGAITGAAIASSATLIRNVVEDKVLKGIGLNENIRERVKTVVNSKLNFDGLLGDQMLSKISQLKPAKKMKQKEMFAQVATALTNVEYKEYIPENETFQKNFRFNLQQLKDKFGSDIFTEDQTIFDMTPHTINLLIWAGKIVKEISTIQKKYKKEGSEVTNPLNCIKDTFFAKDGLVSILGNRPSGNSESFTLNNVDEQSTIKQADGYQIIEESEPVLYYGWNTAGTESPLPGEGAYDLLFIIKRVPEIVDRLTVLSANLKIIPEGLPDKPGGCSVEFESIKYYSSQYYKYYKDATYRKVSDDEYLEYQYMIFCLNGVALSMEDFSFFLSTVSPGDEFHKYTDIMFDICYVNGERCIVSSSSITPEPEKERLKIIKKLTEQVKKLIKENAELTSEDMEMINPMLEDMNVEENIKIIEGDTIKLDNNLSFNLDYGSGLKEFNLEDINPDQRLLPREYNTKYNRDLLLLEDDANISLETYTEILNKEETASEKLWNTYKKLAEELNDLSSRSDWQLLISPTVVYKLGGSWSKEDFEHANKNEIDVNRGTWKNPEREKDISPHAVQIQFAKLDENVKKGVLDLLEPQKLNIKELLESHNIFNSEEEKYTKDALDILQNSYESHITLNVMNLIPAMLTYARRLVMFATDYIFTQDSPYNDLNTLVNESNGYNDAYYLFNMILMYLINCLTYFDFIGNPYANGELSKEFYEFLENCKTLLESCNFEDVKTLAYNARNYVMRITHKGFTDRDIGLLEASYNDCMKYLKQCFMGVIEFLYENTKLVPKTNVKIDTKDLSFDPDATPLYKVYYYRLIIANNNNRAISQGHISSWEESTYKNLEQINIEDLKSQTSDIEFQKLFTVYYDILMGIWSPPLFCFANAQDLHGKIFAIKTLQSVVSGSIEGGGFGTSFGPIGIIAGAAIGAVYGGVSAVKNAGVVQYY